MQIKIKLALLVGDLILLTLCLAAGTYIRLSDVASLYERYATACGSLPDDLPSQPLPDPILRSAAGSEFRREPAPASSGLADCGHRLLFLLFLCSGRSFRPRHLRHRQCPLRLLAPGLAPRDLLRLRRRSLAILLMGNPAAVETARQLIREFSPLSQTQVWHPKRNRGATAK